LYIIILLQIKRLIIIITPIMYDISTWTIYYSRQIHFVWEVASSLFNGHYILNSDCGKTAPIVKNIR
jgi:hypothetical protein